MMGARKSLAGPWVVAAVCVMVLAACSSPTGSTAGGGAGAAGGSGEIEIEDASAFPDRNLNNGDTVDFGSVGVSGGSTQRDFTITNTGSDDLSLTGSPRVVIDEPGIDVNFILISAPSTDTLQPGEEATFTIQFSPMSPAPGTFSATATIPSSDGDENPFVINLDGESIFIDNPGPGQT